MSEVHISVMRDQALDAWIGDPDRLSPEPCFIDATYGRGGHSFGWLEVLGPKVKNLSLMVIDKDAQAINHAQAEFVQPAQQAGVDVRVQQGSFANTKAYVQSSGWVGRVQGLLLDLGVCSPQLDTPERGFSFMQDGPLDMRMDTGSGQPAWVWLANASEREIRQILWDYGEEKYARSIARAIVTQREQAPIKRTGDLANLIAQAVPKVRGAHVQKHPATRSFQAIRIHVNQELEDLRVFLEDCLDVLAVGGRLVVISFHSLEDRMVKQFMQKEAKGDPYPRHLPIRHDELKPRLKLVSKAQKPSKQEIDANVRARSAVMRVAEKVR